jgi:hypothetical protein
MVKVTITDPDALCGASIAARRILQYGRPPDLFHRTMPVVLFGRPIEQRCRYLSDSDINHRHQPSKSTALFRSSPEFVDLSSIAGKPTCSKP